MISDTKWESFEIDIKLDPHIKLFTAAMLRKDPKFIMKILKNKQHHTNVSQNFVHRLKRLNFAHFLPSP